MRAAAARPVDRARQATVVVAEVLCVLGTLVGTGVLGTRVAESSGRTFDDQATLLAPLGPAFSIWSVVYAGLAAYAVLQLLPGQATSPRHRAVGWWVAASMVLNAGWLLVTQQGWVGTSVAVVLALLAVLVVAVRALVRHPADGLAERVVTDGTLGLYLGWVAVATFANVAAWERDAGAITDAGVREALAVLAVVLVVALSAALAAGLGARLAVAGATTWGLVWLAAGRLSDEPSSTPVGVAAVVAAVAVPLLVVVLRRRASGPQASSRSPRATLSASVRSHHPAENSGTATTSSGHG